MRVLILILSISLLSISACKKRNKDGEDELIVPKTYTLKGRAYNSSGLITNNALQFKIERKKPTISGKIDQVHLGAVKADSSGYFEFTYTEQENALNNPNLFHITIGLGEFSIVSNIPVHQDIEEEFSSIPIIDLDVTFINSKPESKNDTFRYAFYNSDNELSLISDSALAKDYPDSFTVNFSNFSILFTTRDNTNLKSMNYKYSSKESGNSYDRIIYYQNRYVLYQEFPDYTESYKRNLKLNYKVYW